MYGKRYWSQNIGLGETYVKITHLTRTDRGGKILCKVCGNYEEGTWIDKNFCWRVGQGNEVKFWEDKWVGDEPLRCKFPRLYMISNYKDITLGEIGRQIH